MLRTLLFVLFLLLAPMTVARAAVVEFGGGGGARTDCLTTFLGEPNVPVAAPRHFRCADGDSCDADGVVNGECQFSIAACVNSSFDPARCTTNGVASVSVDHAIDNGEPKFDPDFQALQTRINGLGFPNTTADACALPTNIRVALKGPLARNSCFTGTKTLSLETQSVPQLGSVFRDVDSVRLRCDPSPILGCDPQTFYASTYDRVQRQIFNQSCALSGCHDSQTRAAGLLLESGASFANLVGVAPINGAALTAGWKRVTPADPMTSLLYRKLKTLPSGGYGARMPRGRRQLNPSLIAVVERWIEAGAPETGWVPGTY